MVKTENIICCIARQLGKCYGWSCVRLPEMKKVVLHYLVIQVIVLAFTIAYVEIGHDKGWVHAAEWYTCLHTHHHFGL